MEREANQVVPWDLANLVAKLVLAKFGEVILIMSCLPGTKPVEREVDHDVPQELADLVAKLVLAKFGKAIFIMSVVSRY